MNRLQIMPRLFSSFPFSCILSLDGSRIDSGGDCLSVISELVKFADLVLLCSISSLICYVLLLFPTSLVRTPLFSILCFAFGYGPAPLLLVIIAPFLTEHISTALGLHKSFEMSGSTLMQTVQQIYFFSTHSRVLDFYWTSNHERQNWSTPRHFERLTLSGSLQHSIPYT